MVKSLHDKLVEALNKHDDRYIEGSGPHIKTIEELNASRASAALAVFTQYLQEPDVVERATKAHCRNADDPFGDGLGKDHCKGCPAEPNTCTAMDFFGQGTAAALNSIGGE